LLDGQVRAGVLTRAAWLTRYSAIDNSGPTGRGTFIRSSLLCLPTPPPPPDLAALPPASEAAARRQTTRQVVENYMLSPSGCGACHKLFDPIGFGFEAFDAIGQYRTIENSQPIDDNGQLVGTDIDSLFHGATQLEGALLTSKDFLGCFVTQVYRDAMGQRESADAAATIADLQRCFSVDTPLTDAFAAMVRAPAFVLRKAN
jgi:hypothetical protein